MTPTISSCQNKNIGSSGWSFWGMGLSRSFLNAKLFSYFFMFKLFGLYLCNAKFLHVFFCASWFHWVSSAWRLKQQEDASSGGMPHTETSSLGIVTCELKLWFRQVGDTSTLKPGGMVFFSNIKTKKPGWFWLEICQFLPHLWRKHQVTQDFSCFKGWRNLAPSQKTKEDSNCLNTIHRFL